MPSSAEFKLDIPSAELFYQLTTAEPPGALRAEPARRTFHRDLYLDTPDLALWRRGVACRLRLGADDRRAFSVLWAGPGGFTTVGAHERFEAAVPDLEPERVVRGDTEPARRLRGLIDPTLLRTVLELETERWVRAMRAGWLRRRRFEFTYDRATVRASGLTRTFHELRVRRLRRGAPTLNELARLLQSAHGLRSILEPKFQRGQRLLGELEREAASRALLTGRAVAIIAVADGRIALVRENGSLELPVSEGSGEEACRHLMRRRFGSGVGELTLLGTAPPVGLRPTVEVWLARRVRRDAGGSEGEVVWLALGEVMAKVGTPVLHHPESLAALTVAARSELPEWSAAEPAPRPPPAQPVSRPAPRPARETTGETAAQGAGLFLDPELSQLEFHARVLALAEDPAIPLLERLRFLAIVGSNLDEFFMVSVGGLKRRLARAATGGDGARQLDEQLDAIGLRVRALIARQQACLRSLLAQLGREGVRLRRWSELDEEAQARLGREFRDRLFPILTPRAITTSPGFPLPVIPHLTLSLAVAIQDFRTGPLHFAYLKLPDRLPRLLQVGQTREYVPIEDVVRAHLDELYPNRVVEAACLFRVTRGGDLAVIEDAAGDLLQAIEEEVNRRPHYPAVRVEVERGMPSTLRELLLRELRYERSGPVAPLRDADIYEIDGFVGLGGLRELADLPLPRHRFPPFQGRAPLPADRPIWDVLRERDVLVHHPYDDFAATAQRFVEEAAADPDVEAIRITLYRAGDQSPIVDALEQAAAGGKEVAVFVELKARFDEERNIGWVRRLERAGAHVVYGLVGLKNHAKVALVVRREGAATRRYVHLGTGNYNPATARIYTDLGLLSAEEELGQDLTDLFNELTGSSEPPQAPYRRLLVGPRFLLAGFLERIEREIAHAAAGRSGRIRAKLNGLADPEIVRALYRASQAGVELELVVRGICTLRPGIPGLSERIRVVSLLGRFLEHARIYHFGNGGEDEYLIGSADWRPRNLRRRIETVVPVRDPAAQRRLDEILTRELADPTGWLLEPEGTYLRRAPLADSVSSAQDEFLAAVGA